MFKKSDKQQSLDINQQEISTIIGEGYVFTGEIKGSSVIRVEGKVVGNIEVESGVILGEKGHVEGNIITRSAIIYGTINGNVTSGQLEIKKSGLVNGDITTDTLEIELGAQYNGKLNMQRKTVEEGKAGSMAQSSGPDHSTGSGSKPVSSSFPEEAKKAS